jgi:hypothetical protein
MLDMNPPPRDAIWLPLTQRQLDELNAGETVSIEIPRDSVITFAPLAEDPPVTVVMIRRMPVGEHSGQ